MPPPIKQLYSKFRRRSCHVFLACVLPNCPFRAASCDRGRNIRPSSPGGPAADRASKRAADTGRTFKGVGAVSAAAIDPPALRLCRAVSQRRAGLSLQARLRRRVPASEGRNWRRREFHLRQRAFACHHPRGVGASQGPRLRVLVDEGGPQPQSAGHARLPAVVLSGLAPRPFFAGRHRLVRRLSASRPQAVRDGGGLDLGGTERERHRPQLDRQQPSPHARCPRFPRGQDPGPGLRQGVLGGIRRVRARPGLPPRRGGGGLPLRQRAGALGDRPGQPSRHHAQGPGLRQAALGQRGMEHVGRKMGRHRRDVPRPADQQTLYPRSHLQDRNLVPHRLDLRRPALVGHRGHAGQDALVRALRGLAGHLGRRAHHAVRPAGLAVSRRRLRADRREDLERHLRHAEGPADGRLEHDRLHRWPHDPDDHAWPKA